MIVAVFLENQMESLFPLTTERDDYVLLDLQAISVNPVLSIDYWVVAIDFNAHVAHKLICSRCKFEQCLRTVHRVLHIPL